MTEDRDKTPISPAEALRKLDFFSKKDLVGFAAKAAEELAKAGKNVPTDPDALAQGYTALQQEIESGQYQKERRVKELAAQIKREGMGQIFGKISGYVRQVGEGFSAGPGFILGEEVDQSDWYSLRNTVAGNREGLVGVNIPESIEKTRGRENHQQVWIIDDYGFRGRSYTRSMGMEDPPTFKGKKGEEGWTKYTYYQPCEVRTDKRPGGFFNHIVVVPPHIAEQIDQEVEEDVYFPDKLQKELFPGIVGPGEDSIQRFEATELHIIDRRGDFAAGRITEQGTVRPYSEPLKN